MKFSSLIPIALTTATIAAQGSTVVVGFTTTIINPDEPSPGGEQQQPTPNQTPQSPTGVIVTPTQGGEGGGEITTVTDTNTGTGTGTGTGTDTDDQNTVTVTTEATTGTEGAGGAGGGAGGQANTTTTEQAHTGHNETTTQTNQTGTGTATVTPTESPATATNAAVGLAAGASLGYLVALLFVQFGKKGELQILPFFFFLIFPIILLNIYVYDILWQFFPVLYVYSIFLPICLYIYITK